MRSTSKAQAIPNPDRSSPASRSITAARSEVPGRPGQRVAASAPGAAEGRLLAPCLVTEESHQPRTGCVGSNDDGAFARGHVLALLQAERSDRSDQPTVLRRKIGLGAV